MDFGCNARRVRFRRAAPLMTESAGRPPRQFGPRPWADRGFFSLNRNNLARRARGAFRILHGPGAARCNLAHRRRARTTKGNLRGEPAHARLISRGHYAAYKVFRLYGRAECGAQRAAASARRISRDRASSGESARQRFDLFTPDRSPSPIRRGRGLPA